MTAALLSACRSEPASTIRVRVGEGPDQQRSFVPKVALAEYLNVPDLRGELRLTLADYDAPCDRFVPPDDDQTNVSVLIVTPKGVIPSPGTYPWGGPEAHGGTAAQPERPFAVPKVHLGPHSHLFPPGGSVRLTRVGLERDGQVEGVLDLEFPGDAQRPAASLRGNFQAQICKTNR